MPFSRWNADSLACAFSRASRSSLARLSKKVEYCRAGSTRRSSVGVEVGLHEGVGHRRRDFGSERL